MAQLQFPFSDLCQLVQLAGEEEAIEQLTMLGFPTEKTAEGELNVEVTPNRPDALSVEGIARALRSYRTGQPSVYEVGRSAIEVRVDPSVEAVRPAFGGAYVKGVGLSDSSLRSLMQLQEKLHETLGRKRRKVAIGIHDADRVSPPFRYFACGREEVSFVPLDRSEKMTPLEILRRHEKGMAFEHLVGERCPMIEDRSGNILSFPPIINGELTKLSLETKNVFVDCTGTSEEAVLQSVNIVCAALADRGGQIKEIAVNRRPYRIMQEKAWPLPVKESGRLLGVNLPPDRVQALLSKMGYRVEGEVAYSPGFRSDILSEVDLIEDVAIAYGFNNFEPTLPSFATYGKAANEPPYHEILVGMGYDEAVSWMLSNQEKERKGGIPDGAAFEMENPLTAEYTRFRRALLPNMLSLLCDSKDEKLPIRLYEIGPVAEKSEGVSLCLAAMHSKASFSEIKGAVLSLFSTAGKTVELFEAEFGPFIKGRCAKVVLEGNEIGHLGEIAPEVLSDFGIEQPVAACEVRI